MSFEPEKSLKLPQDFDFDYDLLDKLLHGIPKDAGNVEDIVMPVPGTEERNNRLGSEWIKQLEQDLVNMMDEETLSQCQSISAASPSPVNCDDFFDQEWNEISNFLSMNPSPIQSADYFATQMTPSQNLNTSTDEALILNRELQGHIKTILERTNFLEQQQRDLERVTELLNSQVDKKFKRKYMDLPFWPHQIPTLSSMDKIVQEARGTVPMQSDQRLVTIDTKLKEYMKNLKTIPRWTFKERSSLAQGIRAQNEKILLGIIQAKGSHSLEECKKIIASFNEVDLLMNVNGIDWESIAIYFVQTRSATDCRLQWTINDHPMINRSPIFEENEEEIEKLNKIVPKIFKQVKSKGLPEGFCSPWQLIASQLGTNRTAIQCFMMFQRKLNPNFLKGKWTTEEDEQLMAAVRIYGTQNWQAVAQTLDGRTGQQCLHRYEKAINPQIKRGRWSADEDELLRQAVKPFIQSGVTRINWSAVKLTVPGRTDVQCRERWVNILDPSISAAPFTPAEDRKLLEMVELYGTGNWSKISQEFGKTRTDNQLWRRWKQISKKKRSKPTKKAALKKKK